LAFGYWPIAQLIKVITCASERYSKIENRKWKINFPTGLVSNKEKMRFHYFFISSKNALFALTRSIFPDVVARLQK